jgi:hypothetical protein
MRNGRHGRFMEFDDVLRCLSERMLAHASCGTWDSARRTFSARRAAV